eukprot:COSAG06_NODE_176_length_21031_cov_66.751290_15_plen_114_part_00
MMPAASLGGGGGGGRDNAVSVPTPQLEDSKTDDEPGVRRANSAGDHHGSVSSQHLRTCCYGISPHAQAKTAGPSRLDYSRRLESRRQQAPWLPEAGGVEAGEAVVDSSTWCGF